MKKEFIDWLDNIEKLDGKPPIDVIAYNFGLMESDQGFVMYIVGGFEYSEEDDDWACIEPPTKPYRYLRFPDELQAKSWNFILDYSEGLLKDLEKEGSLGKTILQDAKAITTGFDDGELIKIR